jgi:hypothetical protein
MEQHQQQQRFKTIESKDLVNITKYLDTVLIQFDPTLAQKPPNALALNTELELEIRLGRCSGINTATTDNDSVKAFSSGLMPACGIDNSSSEDDKSRMIEMFLKRLAAMDESPAVVARLDWSYTIETVEHPASPLKQLYLSQQLTETTTATPQSKIRIMRRTNQDCRWSVSKSYITVDNVNGDGATITCLDVLCEYLGIDVFSLANSVLISSADVKFIKAHVMTPSYPLVDGGNLACEKIPLHDTTALCIAANKHITLGDLKLQLSFEKTGMIADIPVRLLKAVSEQLIATAENSSTSSGVVGGRGRKPSLQKTASTNIKAKRIAATTVKGKKTAKATAAVTTTASNLVLQQEVLQQQQQLALTTRSRIMVTPKIHVPLVSLTARKAEYRFKMRRSWVIGEQVPLYNNSSNDEANPPSSQYTHVLRPLWRFDVTFTWHCNHTGATSASNNNSEMACLQKVAAFCRFFLTKYNNNSTDFPLLASAIKQIWTDIAPLCVTTTGTTTTLDESLWPNVEFELECIDAVFQFTRNEVDRSLRSTLKSVFGLMASMSLPLEKLPSPPSFNQEKVEQTSIPTMYKYL